MASLAIQSQIDMESRVPYRLINYLIHFGVGFTIYLLFIRILGTKYYWLAILMALLFLAHPLNTQAVTYISQRLASTVAFFYLQSLYWYLRYIEKREKKYLLTAFAVGFLAVFSKQNSATICASWLLLDLVFGKETRKNWWPPTQAIIGGLTLLSLSLLSEFTGQSATLYDIQNDHTQPTQPGFILTQPLVVFRYIRTFFWPHDLCLEHDVLVVQSVLSPRFFVPVLIHATILACIALIPWRHRKMMLFGACYYYLALIPESSIFPLIYVQEHRSYLPMFGLLCVVAGVVLQFEKYWKVTVPLLVAATIALGIATYQRNLVWQSRETLWQDVVKKSPGRFRAYHNLGIDALKRQDFETAYNLYLKAIRLSPNTPALYHNMGVAATQLRKPVQAIAAWAQYASFHPGPVSFYNLGVVLLSTRQPDAAIMAAERCLEFDPNYKQCQLLLEDAKNWAKTGMTIDEILTGKYEINTEIKEHIEVEVEEKDLQGIVPDGMKDVIQQEVDAVTDQETGSSSETGEK